LSDNLNSSPKLNPILPTYPFITAFPLLLESYPYTVIEVGISSPEGICTNTLRAPLLCIIKVSPYLTSCDPE
jgi:hypothetical protein